MDSERESKILVKSPKQRNKAQRKIDYKNYDTITMSEIITRNYQLVNYQEKLSASILCRGKCGNYQLVYYVAENVEIIGILAYPKIILLWFITEGRF